MTVLKSVTGACDYLTGAGQRKAGVGRGEPGRQVSARSAHGQGADMTQPQNPHARRRHRSFGARLKREFHAWCVIKTHDDLPGRLQFRLHRGPFAHHARDLAGPGPCGFVVRWQLGAPLGFRRRGRPCPFRGIILFGTQELKKGGLSGFFSWVSEFPIQTAPSIGSRIFDFACAFS